MKGGRARVNLLRSLGEQKNKLQLAKELGMDWKDVDRNIQILLKYGLIRESESVGKVKYYSLTPDGNKVLELLEELNNVNQESGGKDL
jgi:DNA-binding MarR family transcriptional regulator